MIKEKKYIELGQRLKEIREDFGLSQKKMAQILDVHKSLISDFERGRIMVKNVNAMRLVKALSEKFFVNPKWLLEAQGVKYQKFPCEFIKLYNIKTQKDLKSYIMENHQGIKTWVDLEWGNLLGKLHPYLNRFFSELEVFKEIIKTYMTGGLNALSDWQRSRITEYYDDKQRVRDVLGIKKKFHWRHFLETGIKERADEPFTYAYSQFFRLIELETFENFKGEKLIPGLVLCQHCDMIFSTDQLKESRKCPKCGNVLR